MLSFFGSAAAVVIDNGNVEAPSVSLTSAAAVVIDNGNELEAPSVSLTASGSSEATYDSNCDLGKGYFLMSQECGGRAFTWTENDCDGFDATGTYCISKSTDNTQQQAKEITVSSTSTLDSLLSSMSSVAGSGYGVKITASAEYVSSHTSSTNSVSFYKTSIGDSYDKHIKYTENLKLNDAAKTKLANDPEQFVKDYGSRFISKIVYSNYFIANVKVEQTSSEDSSSLGIMASIESSKLFNLDASTEFNTASTEGSTSLSITTEALYNGATILDTSSTKADDVVGGIMNAYEEWRTNVNAAAVSKDDAYAKPTRMVYSKWTELEEVQAMFPDGFPAALTANAPSAVVLDYLHRDTIRTSADRNAIESLLAWSCVQPSYSDLATAIRAVDTKLFQHQVEIDSLDESSMASLEEMVLNGDTSWFVGMSGEFIGEVNNLMLTSGQCQGGSANFKSENYEIQAKTNKLRMPDAGADAFLQGFQFSAGKINLNDVQIIGQTVGYQKVTEENQVNGGGMQKTSQGIWRYYEGGSLDNTANFGLECAKEGMYMSGLHVQYTDVVCACATPNEGYSGHNQRQCTDGYQDWCTPSQKCGSEKAYSKANIGNLCKSRRRRASFESKMISLKNEKAGTAYGRITSMTVHCMPLPVGSYGLPSSTSTSGPYTITNQAGKLVSQDCPDGEAVYAIDWVGISRAENNDFGSVWTINQKIKLYCRSFADFQTEASSQSAVAATKSAAE